jgi:hypothetical protein
VQDYSSPQNCSTARMASAASVVGSRSGWSIRDLSRVSDEEEAHSRLVLAK